MCLLIHSNVIRYIFVYVCIFLTVMARTKRPAVLLLVFGTLLAVVSTSEGSNSTKPQGQGIPLNNFLLNQMAQNILTDPNALDNYLQQFLPTIMKSLPPPASNSTKSPTSALLRKILMDMAGLYTNQIQPTDDIGLAEAQLVEMLQESMKNPVVRGIVVQMAQTLVAEVRLDCPLRPGPEVITLFSCSTQLSTKFQLLIKLKYRQMKKFLALNRTDVVSIMLINVKMPTIVDILIFRSRINFVLS